MTNCKIKNVLTTINKDTNIIEFINKNLKKDKSIVITPSYKK